MKAEELMVGDWVRVKAPYFKKNKAYRVVEVRLPGVATANVELPDEDEEASMTGEFLFGIPLTPEILEKNGWKEWIEHSTIARSISVLIEENTNFCIQEVKGQDAMFVQIHHCGAGTFEFRKHIKYIHELQHALRLCGIEKEIVI